MITAVVADQKPTDLRSVGLGSETKDKSTNPKT